MTTALVPPAAWPEFSRCVLDAGEPRSEGTWGPHLVGIASSDLSVAREYEGSVQDWSVSWDTSTLRQRALKPALKDRLFRQQMQTESVRVFLHERGGFEAYRMNATVTLPNWGARENYVSRNVANVGLGATVDEVVTLLDAFVPLGPTCRAPTWSTYDRPADFRQRYVRGLAEDEWRKAVEAQPAGLRVPKGGRRLFTLASLQRVVQAALQEKPLICP